MALISYLTTVRLDVGARKHLAEDLKAAGITRPLLVTDRGIRAVGLLDQVLKEGGIDLSLPVFDETPANPTEEAAEKALELYRVGTCDGVIALGGGSAMDLAKAVAVLATHDGPLASFAVVNGGCKRSPPRRCQLLRSQRLREQAVKSAAAPLSVLGMVANSGCSHPSSFPKERFAILN